MKYEDPKQIAKEDAAAANNPSDLVLRTKKRHITPRTAMQGVFIETMNKYEMVFGLGPAGTGKTFLAVAKAVSAMLEGQVDKIILTRPAVEAGENLGFLPGDLKEKIDPYLRPLYDALYEMLPADIVDKKLENGEIEIAPLAYMRGRTLSHAVIILDEAQNTTGMQMKMFLTRLGEGSRMIVNGDLTQTDLPRGVTSGLVEAVRILKNVPDIGFVTFSEKDVVRHGLVSKIVKAYEQANSEGNHAAS
jgi:phosphate starvation-inducible PhoH-like protein